MADNSDTIDFEEKIDVCLKTFFGPPNQIALNTISPRGSKNALMPWVERARHQKPTVLPCRSNGQVTWYGMAFSDRQLGELRDHLLAFVGPTYSTFRGMSLPAEADNPIDAAATRMTGGRVLRFRATNDKEAWARLEKWRQLMDRAPEASVEELRPDWQVRRDFEMALAAGDEKAAAAKLEVLSARNRLDPLNVLFMRVQMHSALGAWQSLLSLPELPTLLQVRRPPAVTEALLEALYHVEFVAAGLDILGEAAAQHLVNSVVPRHASLFAQRSGIRSGGALKLLMLDAVSTAVPKPEARDAYLLIQGVSHDDRNILEALAKRLPPTLPAVPADVLAQARVLVDSARYDDACDLLRSAPPTTARARVLLQCARELESLEAAVLAESAVSSLTGQEREELLKSKTARDLFEYITGRTRAGGKRLPTNWLEWFDQMPAAPERCLQIIRRSANEWTVDGLLALPDAVSRFVQAIKNADDGELLQQSIPHLQMFFQRDPQWPRAELREAYYRTLERVAYASRAGSSELAVFLDLATAVLSLGISQNEYDELMDWAEVLIEETASVNAVGWGLDVLDLLSTHPCPDPVRRVTFLTRLGALFTRYWQRLDGSHWMVLKLLCDELGQSALYAGLSAARGDSDDVDADGSSACDLLKGKVVAIYTLTEGAGQRAKEFLEKAIDGVRVILFHEKGGTDSMRQSARTVDLFVIATASATHAATGFIEMHRPADKPTVKPAGKGSSSMIRAVLDFVSREQQESSAAA